MPRGARVFSRSMSLVSRGAATGMVRCLVRLLSRVSPLLLAACVTRSASPPSSATTLATSPETATAAQPSAETAPPADEDVARAGTLVRLVHPGVAPRLAYAHAPVPGPEAALRVDVLRTSRETTTDAAGKLPALPFDLEVSKTFALRIQPGAEPSHPSCAVAAGMTDDDLWFTQGLQCSLGIDRTGAIDAVEMYTRDQQTGDDDDAGDGVLQTGPWFHDVRFTAAFLSLPWPTEAVGVGAKWRAHQLLRVDRAVVRRLLELELVSASPPRVRVRFVDTAVVPQLLGREPDAYRVLREVPKLETQLPAQKDPWDSGTRLEAFEHHGEGLIETMPGSTWIGSGELKTRAEHRVFYQGNGMRLTSTRQLDRTLHFDHK